MINRLFKQWDKLSAYMARRPVPSVDVAPVENDDDPIEKTRRGAFSTDLKVGPDARAAAAQRFEQFRRALAASHRMAAVDIDGVAMDSADGVSDSVLDSPGSNALKDIFAFAQPNLSAMLMDWYISQSFIGHQLCAIVAQHWLIDKICRGPARDAIRQGFEIVSADGDNMNEDAVKILKRFDKRYKLRHNCEEFVNFGRVFGIRIMIYKVDSDDPDYYMKPFNPDGIRPGTYRGMVQVDPYWCAPELDAESSAQPDSMHFYEPTWWMINGTRYHRTHLSIFRTASVPDLLKPSYLYGGKPIPQLALERVYAAERTANEAPQLAMAKRVLVYKTDMAKVMANPQGMAAGMELWSQTMNNFGIQLADKKEDDVEQFDLSLADLDAIIMSQYQLVSAIGGYPSTKLLGTSPKGFGASGEYEESSYHEELESIQTNDLVDMIDRHHLCVMRSDVVPAMRRRGDPSFTPFETTVEFKPLDTPTAAEMAAINLQKAQTDAALVELGAIDNIDVRNRLINDKGSDYAAIPELVREEPPAPAVPAGGDNGATVVGNASATPADAVQPRNGQATAPGNPGVASAPAAALAQA